MRINAWGYGPSDGQNSYGHGINKRNLVMKPYWVESDSGSRYHSNIYKHHLPTGTTQQGDGEYISKYVT